VPAPIGRFGHIEQMFVVRQEQHLRSLRQVGQHLEGRRCGSSSNWISDVVDNHRQGFTVVEMPFDRRQPQGEKKLIAAAGAQLLHAQAFAVGARCLEDLLVFVVVHHDTV
jgi:hypothetical protein